MANQMFHMGLVQLATHQANELPLGGISLA